MKNFERNKLAYYLLPSTHLEKEKTTLAWLYVCLNSFNGLIPRFNRSNLKWKPYCSWNRINCHAFSSNDIKRFSQFAPINRQCFDQIRLFAHHAPVYDIWMSLRRAIYFIDDMFNFRNYLQCDKFINFCCVQSHFCKLETVTVWFKVLTHTSFNSQRSIIANRKNC